LSLRLGEFARPYRGNGLRFLWLGRACATLFIAGRKNLHQPCTTSRRYTQPTNREGQVLVCRVIGNMGTGSNVRKSLFSERLNRAAARLMLLDLFVARERCFWNLAVISRDSF